MREAFSDVFVRARSTIRIGIAALFFPRVRGACSRWRCGTDTREVARRARVRRRHGRTHRR